MAPSLPTSAWGLPATEPGLSGEPDGGWASRTIPTCPRAPVHNQGSSEAEVACCSLLLRPRTVPHGVGCGWHAVGSRWTGQRASVRVNSTFASLCSQATTADLYSRCLCAPLQPSWLGWAEAASENWAWGGAGGHCSPLLILPLFPDSASPPTPTRISSAQPP